MTSSPEQTRREQQRRLRAFSRSLPMTILRAREAIMAFFRPILGKYDLSEQQWRVLRFLDESGGVRPGDLSAATKIHVSSLSRIIATLRARGLITRHEDSGDMRAALVAITQSGAELVTLIGPELEVAYEQIELRIGYEDIQAMTNLARKIENTLKEDV